MNLAAGGIREVIWHVDGTCKELQVASGTTLSSAVAAFGGDGARESKVRVFVCMDGTLFLEPAPLSHTAVSMNMPLQWLEQRYSISSRRLPCRLDA